jgi:hypothetical protein
MPTLQIGRLYGFKSTTIFFAMLENDGIFHCRFEAYNLCRVSKAILILETQFRRQLYAFPTPIDNVKNYFQCSGTLKGAATQTKVYLIPAQTAIIELDELREGNS